MARYTSEAIDITSVERDYERQQTVARPSVEVVPGGGLDAHARRGVSTQFVSAVMTVVLAFALIFTIGVGRVVLSTMTVSKLQANNETRTALRQMTAENDNLRISRSLLSSNTRIEKIATQRYGMKLSENRAVLNVNNSPQA